LSRTIDLDRSHPFVRSSVLPPAPPRLRAAGDAVHEARESGKARSADAGPTVALMAFGLEAKTTLARVLIFGTPASQATLHPCSGKVSVDTPPLEVPRPDLSEPLKEQSRSFICGLRSRLLKPAA
jgi:hypothetical protein